MYSNKSYLLRYVANVKTRIDHSAGVFLQLTARHVQHVLTIVIGQSVSGFQHFQFDADTFAKEGGCLFRHR